jgi:hypothetical protein
VLRLRAPKLRETARYPEYQVPPSPRRPRNRSSAVHVSTGTEAFRLEISMGQLRLNNILVTSTIDNRQFHDYCLEGTPGAGCRLCVDGDAVGSALPLRTRERNQVPFGDLSPATGNFRARVTHLSLTQVEPGTQAPNGAEGSGVEDLLHYRPFAALGSIDVGCSHQSALYKLDSARGLHEVVRRCSRIWRLGPKDPIVPVDFAHR